MTTLPGVDAAPRDASKSQWYTPPELAERIVAWALHPAPVKSVLEPSCGDGALLAAIVNYCGPWLERVEGIDIDASNIARCRNRFRKWMDYGDLVLSCDDFLTTEPFEGTAFEGTEYDLAIMNPPFKGGQTEAHILHALKWADRVVCHCPLTTLGGKARKASLWSRVSLTRMVIHSTRPKYGNGKAGATAMCTVEVVPELQDGTRTAIEWW